MRVSVVDDLGAFAGKIWRTSQSEGATRFAAPLSSTPLPIFKWVIKNATSFPSWNAVNFVLMDEQVDGDSSPCTYVSTNDPASYEGFAQRHLLGPLADAIRVNVPVVKPDLSLISSFTTPIDLLILAIGPSGNYANVMPGTPVEVGWHVARLTDEFRTSHTRAGSDSYEGAAFRTHGMSLGPQQVLNAKQVVVIASGEKKKQLVDQLLSKSEFDPQFPISIVHHPMVSDRVVCAFSGGAH